MIKIPNLWHTHKQTPLPCHLLPAWMNRAEAGPEAAATATHESMQGNSDMGAPGTRRCGDDDYTRAIPMGSSSRRITEGLGGWQWQRDAARAATAASTLRELGFWVRGTEEPFKVRQVNKRNKKRKATEKKHWGKKRVIKRRYPSVVLTAFAR